MLAPPLGAAFFAVQAGLLVCLALSASLIAATNKFFVRRSMSGAFLCAGFGLRGNGARAVAPARYSIRNRFQVTNPQNVLSRAKMLRP